MATTRVAGEAVRLPERLLRPPPPPLPELVRSARANVPTDVRVPVQDALPDIAVPSTELPFDVVMRIVPRLFMLDNDPLRDGGDDVHMIDAPYPPVSCEVRNSDFNRSLLVHALYGFSFQTVPHVMKSLRQAAKGDSIDDEDDKQEQKQSSQAPEHEESPPLQPVPTERATAANWFKQWARAAARFQRNVISFNLVAISNLLNLPSTWTFALHLHSSPYFGHAGLEARIVLFSPDFNFLSFHLLGISDPHTDLPNLVLLLQTLCPDVNRKLMGVQMHLTPAEHRSMTGASASRVLAAFYRLAPRKPLFFTPDVQQSLPQPALLPHQLAALTSDQMKQLVDQYLLRLQLSWSQQQIQQVLDDHSALSSQSAQLQDASQNESDISFERSWAFAEKQFRQLRLFVGGLATASAYKTPQSQRVSITALELTTNKAAEVNVVADIILQARQYVQLRTFILPESCKDMSE